jgi:hypothetical protein
MLSISIYHVCLSQLLPLLRKRDGGEEELMHVRDGHHRQWPVYVLIDIQLKIYTNSTHSKVIDLDHLVPSLRSLIVHQLLHCTRLIMCGIMWHHSSCQRREL